MISVCNYSFLINQPGIKRGRGFISRKTFHFAFTHLVNGQYTVFKYIMYEISVWLAASRRHDCSTVLRRHQVNILFLLLYTCAFLQFSSSLSICMARPLYCSGDGHSDKYKHTDSSDSIKLYKLSVANIAKDRI